MASSDTVQPSSIPAQVASLLFYPVKYHRAAIRVMWDIHAFYLGARVLLAGGRHPDE
ncbi:MAG: hypothetical protein ACFE8Z_10205 [Candidatus Hermodarchaeota archaeon]